ncbi:MAG: DinB family protein [Actinomycetota bacterium]|nr:DinB family protein [Actinomycetota bacterium]
MSNGYVCPDCGLDYDTVSPPDAKVAVRSFPRRYRTALAAAFEDDADEGLVRRRPEADTWSALEYTVHVADLYELFANIVRRMYDESGPTIDFWDPDARAASEGYGTADPAATLDRLDAAATALGTELDRVDADGWRRTATFPFGDRDLLTMARNAVHEGTHHLRDVERVLESARRAR